MAESDTKSLTERVKQFLASHGGDAEKAVGALLKDNLRYRTKLREARETGSPYKGDEQLQRENDELSRENDRLSGLVPAAGALVLTGDDAKAWLAYKALNLAPDKIADAVKQRDELTVKLAERDRADVLARAAETVGYKPSVFAKVIAAEKLHVEFKDVAEKGDDGKPVTRSVPHVRAAANDKAPLEPLAEYAERELGDYLPALQADSDERRTRESDADRGVEYPEQKRGGGKVAAGPALEKLVEQARASGDYNLL